MRDIVFISHATPEDNEFTIWVASRLQLLGYKVWIDKNELLGGEKFWEEIDRIIRHKACKFLLIYSENICIDKQAGRLKDGIYKEYSLAEGISKQERLTDYTVLLNIDGSKYNLFIGADRLTQISFYENWANGLLQLTKKLEKDRVKRFNENTNPGFAHWYENKYITKTGIVAKKELYFSSWWPIFKLPESFFIYQFDTESQAEALYKKENSYPVGRIANVLSSFDPNFAFTLDQEPQLLPLNPKNTYQILIADIFSGFEGAEFPTHQDATNHLRRLLGRTFHLIMKNRGMYWYQMANRRLTYFYTPGNLKSRKVSFEYSLGKGKRKKTKVLIGTYLSMGNWHFAVSVKPIFSPSSAFNLKSHIVFTSNGFDVWEDQAKMHTHRRRKGRRFFNEEWRDMLFAFLHGLKRDEKIELALNGEFTLSMEPWTKVYQSDFGYYEPKDKDRQNILDDYQEDEEEEDRIEEADISS